MRRECRERFPHHRGLAIPTCIRARAWRTCRDACRDWKLGISFEVGGESNVLGIPGACAKLNFTYLVRGAYLNQFWIVILLTIVYRSHLTRWFVCKAIVLLIWDNHTWCMIQIYPHCSCTWIAAPALTDWGRDKFAAILQIHCSNTFSWIKCTNFA